MELLQLQGHRRRRRRYSRLSLSFVSQCTLRRPQTFSFPTLFSTSPKLEIRKILNGGATVLFRFNVDYSLLANFYPFLGSFLSSLPHTKSRRILRSFNGAQASELTRYPGSTMNTYNRFAQSLYPISRRSSPHR